MVANGGGPNGTLGEEYTRTYYRYNTEQGVKASTTRNIYGIYDMSGGSWEYMASFLANGTTSYATSMKTKPAKYIEQYAGTGATESAEDRQANYEANTNVYGDAVYEASSKGDGTQSSWNGDYSGFPFLGNPFFMRGGDYGNAAGAGVFYFDRDWGGSAHAGFRVVAL